jgi:hypothetical protein
LSKSDAFETDLLGLTFNATAIADLAENDATSPLTSLFLALHTADPGEAGTQETNEVTIGAYTNYARQAVARNSGGFTVSGNSVVLAANVDFPAGVSGDAATITHWSVGVAVSGATKILYKGPVTPNIAVADGVTPRLTTGTTVTED